MPTNQFRCTKACALRLADRPLSVVWLFCLVVACFPLLAMAQPTESVSSPPQRPADVFQQLSADNWVSREILLSDLGFTGPLVLASPDSVRELYLPVPANVPLSDGKIQLNANYMRSDGGRTALLVSLDTYPVSSRPFLQERGNASLLLDVNGAPRPSGFVRLGLNWGTALGSDTICADSRTPGNVLRVEPDTKFTYRFDSSAVRDLTTAWGALPQTPVILISSRSLASETYDSAWRLGLALERVGKRSQVVALPSVGDTVDLTGVNVPPALRGVPAFAALAQGGVHQLKDAAEVGALMSLGSNSAFRGDIIVADKAMVAAMEAAFDAVSAQLETVAPDAVGSYADWRARSLNLSAHQPASKEIVLARVFGRPTIVVAADAGAKASGLFSAYWNRVAASPTLVVQSADQPTADSSLVSLNYLGGTPGSFNVLANADWNTTFDIGAVAADGRAPATLVLDVSAAPGAARTPPVVSVFMNNILLGAKEMTADGKQERVTVPIPSYALGARNVLRVSFTRQLASDRCRETPEAYPVSVLPSSHMLLKKATPSDDFKGMVSRYATGAHVMVPAAYLIDASNTLPRVIRMAASTGVSPQNARFTAVTEEAMPTPGGAFLVMDLSLKDSTTRVKLEGGRLVITNNSDKPFLDVTGLNNAGVLEVIKVGGDTGVMYRTVGSQPPTMDKAMLLSRGDVALIGSDGLLDEINTADPFGQAVAESQDRPWLLTAGYWWMLPVLAVVFMVALLVSASRMRRRAARKRL